MWSPALRLVAVLLGGSLMVATLELRRGARAATSSERGGTAARAVEPAPAGDANRNGRVDGRRAEHASVLAPLSTTAPARTPATVDPRDRPSSALVLRSPAAAETAVVAIDLTGGSGEAAELAAQRERASIGIRDVVRGSWVVEGMRLPRDGRLAVRLPTGRYRIAATFDRFLRGHRQRARPHEWVPLSIDVSVTAGDRLQLDLPLERTGTLTVESDRPYRELRRGRWTLEDAHTGAARALAAPSWAEVPGPRGFHYRGRWVAPPAPGRYRLLFEDDTLTARSEPFELRAGEPTVVRIDS